MPRRSSRARSRTRTMGVVGRAGAGSACSAPATQIHSETRALGPWHRTAGAARVPFGTATNPRVLIARSSRSSDGPDLAGHLHGPFGSRARRDRRRVARHADVEPRGQRGRARDRHDAVRTRQRARRGPDHHTARGGPGERPGAGRVRRRGRARSRRWLQRQRDVRDGGTAARRVPRRSCAWCSRARSRRSTARR